MIQLSYSINRWSMYPRGLGHLIQRDAHCVCLLHWGKEGMHERMHCTSTVEEVTIFKVIMAFQLRYKPEIIYERKMWLRHSYQVYLLLHIHIHVYIILYILYIYIHVLYKNINIHYIIHIIYINIILYYTHTHAFRWFGHEALYHITVIKEGSS